MTRHNLSAVVRYLRQLAGSGQGDGASDGELLERYVRCRDEAAFELLVWRHGALVFNVCRRILPCEQDAEDAFQATFLAFVRKADSISRRGSLASWLYKVAYRVALEASERMRKTTARENSGGEMLAVQPADDSQWSEVRSILDEELNRLPERLRRPIVLCYLEGKSNTEAAQELHCRLGTIYSRLSRGRELLRQRLQRRGVTLPVAALTAMLAAHAVEAVPAISLVRTAARAALAFADPSALAAVSPRVATLAEGVLRTMFMTKLKIAVVLVLAVGAAASGVLTQAWTAAPPAEAKAEDPPPQATDGDKKAAKPITVKVIKPKWSGLEETSIQETHVLAAQEQQLVPLVSGTVKQVAVDMGDRVKKGQVLIELDAPLLVKEVEQAAAALELAEAQREESGITVQSAKRQVKDGLADPSKLAHSEYNRKAAEAKVKLAIVALRRAEIQVGFTRIHAEFDGVVSHRNCNPGDVVHSGEGRTGKPLLTLLRTDRVRIRMPVPDLLVKLAQPDDPVVLSLQGVSRKLMVGVLVQQSEITGLSGDSKDFITGQKISRISPIMGPGNLRTVVIDVENPKNRLVPGMSVGVMIHFNKTRRFTVPAKCLVRKADGVYYVYVIRDGKAQPTLITLHRVNEEDAGISGIKASDLIAVSNQGELATGTPVKTQLIEDWKQQFRH